MIRPATLADVPKMIEIAGPHLSASSYAPMTYDKDKAADFVSDLISVNGFAAVVENNGNIVGGMLGDVIQPWFSSDKIGIEYIIYIEPEYRQGRDAYHLIRSWLEWCKANECKQIRPSISSGNLRVARLYLAMGFTDVGPNFVLNT